MNSAPALMRATLWPGSLPSFLELRASARSSRRFWVLASVMRGRQRELEERARPGRRTRVEGEHDAEGERVSTRAGLRERKSTHLRFFNAFFFWVKGRLVLWLPPARTTDWISSELMMRVTSGLVILEMGRLQRVRQKRCSNESEIEKNALVVTLEGRSLLVSAEPLVEESEGPLSPDDKTSEVSSGGELEEVEGANVAGLDSGNVAEGANDSVVLVVDDEGSATLAVLASTCLSLSGADLLGRDDLGDVGVGVEALESSDGSLGLGDGLDAGSDDEGDLRDGLDAVTAGEDEGGKGGRGDGGDGGEALLVEVHLDVPLAPDLGRCEHATTTAHVSERGLTTGKRPVSCPSHCPQLFSFGQKDAPVRNGGFLLLQHGGYGQQPFRFPTTRPRSGDQRSRQPSRPGACSSGRSCGSERRRRYG